MSRRDFIPFELRERDPAALEEIMENRQRINVFWDALSGTLDYSNQLLRNNCNNSTISTKFENIKKVRRRSSANINFQRELLTTSLNDKHLLDPMGLKKSLWDLFIAIFILYSAVTVPFRIAFNESVSGAVYITDVLINYLFMLDILVSFNTAIVDRATELLVPDRRVIAMEYLKFWFWIDAASAIPFDEIILAFTKSKSDKDLNTFVLFRLLRLARILRLARVLKLGKLGKQLERLNLNPNYFSAISLMLVIWFGAHIAACVWVTFATSGVNNRNWMTAAPFGDISGYTDLEKYGTAFYWVVLTVLSVGYGDFVPVNVSERLYTMFIELMGGLIFGTVLAQVNRFIESSNPQSRVHRLKMDELRMYLIEKKLPLALKMQITDAYRYYLSNKSVFDEEMILKDLPTVMLTKLVSHAYAKQLKSFGIFRHLEISFAINILVASKPFQVQHGEVILPNHSVTTQWIFVTRGLVQFTTVSDMSLFTVTGYCSDGEYFGDFEYYRRTNRFMDYTAKTNCSLFSVDVRAIDNASKLYPVSAKLLHATISRRYEQYLKARNSKPFINNSGICLREQLWVNGATVANKMNIDSRISRRTLDNIEARSQTQYDADAVFLGVSGKMVRVLEKLDDGTDAVLAHSSTKFLLRRLLIPPDMEHKVYWDIFIGILIFFSVIAVPIQVGFSLDGNLELFVIEMVLNGFFSVDILLSVRTAYYDEVEDALVAIPARIASRYLKTWFVIDFLSCVPFDLILQAVANSSHLALSSLTLLKAVRLFRFFRIARFAKLRKYTDDLQKIFPVDSAAMDALKLIFQFWFVAHILACIYWFTTSLLSREPWFDELNLRHADLSTKYVTSLYFMITTLSQTGYGDIIPINPSERVVMTIIFFFGASLVGYVIANVRLIINTTDAAERRVANKLAEVHGYLNEKNIPDSIRIVVETQMKHHYTHGSTNIEKDIMSALPVFLVNRIISIHYSETLSRIAIFQFIRDDHVVLYIFRMMSSRVYTPGELISIQGQVMNDLIFLTKGKAEIVKRWVVRNKRRHNRREPTVVVRKHLHNHGNSMNKPSEDAPLSARLRYELESKVLSPSLVVIKSLTPKLRNSSRKSLAASSKSELSVRSVNYEAKDDQESDPSMKRSSNDQIRFKEQVICHVHAPDFFGLVSLINDRPQTASLRSTTPCTIFILNEADVRSLINENPTVALILKEAIAKAYLDQQQKLKAVLRSERFLFLKKCKKDGIEMFERKMKAADGNGNVAAKFKGFVRRGSGNHRGSFDSGQKRGSFDINQNSTQRRGSLDLANARPNLSPSHKPRHKFSFSELGTKIRMVSQRAMSFNRGGLAQIERAEAMGLHPDLIAQLKAGSATGKSLNRQDPFLADNSVSMTSLTAEEKSKSLTRSEIVARLERKGTKRKSQLGTAVALTAEPSPTDAAEVGSEGRDSPEKSQDVVPSSPDTNLVDMDQVSEHIDVTTSDKESDYFLEKNNHLVMRSPGKKTNAVDLRVSLSSDQRNRANVAPSNSNDTSETNSPRGRVLSTDSQASIPPSPITQPGELPARNSFKRSNYSPLRERTDEDSESPEKEKPRDDSLLTEDRLVHISEDVLLSVDDRDAPTPFPSLSMVAKQKSVVKLPAITSTVSSLTKKDELLSGTDLIAEYKCGRGNVLDNISSSAEGLEDKEAEFATKFKPGSTKSVMSMSDLPSRNSSYFVEGSSSSGPFSPSLLDETAEFSSQILQKNPSDITSNQPPASSNSLNLPSWRRHVKVLPRAESNESAQSSQSFASNRPTTPRNTAQQPLTSSPQTGRRKSFVESIKSTISNTSGSLSRKTDRNSQRRRSSLNASQIANAFLMTRKKVPFDVCKQEYGHYNSDDDDIYNPPIILQREISIRRVSSTTDIGDLGSAPVMKISMLRRRRSTFPSRDLTEWKEKAIFNMIL